MLSDAPKGLAFGYGKPRVTPRASWLTPKLDAFVRERNHMGWQAIYQAWLDTHPNDPAPANSEKLRLHYRDRVPPKRVERPNPKSDDPNMRPCLECGRTFKKEDRFNFICQPCKKKRG